jgi:hypothetical protein
VRNVPADYTSIQEAIDHCSHGDTVIVSPGVYYENVNFKGKGITVTSVDPANPDSVKNTVINAKGYGSAVTFSNNEGPNAAITGFTITGGYGTVNTAFGNTIYWGAGIYCYRSSPTIAGNIITANSAPKGDANIAGYGCGIGCVESNALITRNTIALNSGYAGGGILIYLGKARIISNMIYANSAIVGGGAVLLGGGQLQNNTIVGNSADGAGNVYAVSDANIGECVVSGNIISNATGGGGIYLHSQKDIDNTAYNNVWQNTGGNYSNAADQAGANGNISADPLFVDAENNDYRLRDGSPCINFGDPNYQAAAGESDFYGEMRIFAGRVDIGADEYSDTFRPFAKAGKDQSIGIVSLPIRVTLDGSASFDPNGNALTYHWRQVGGAAVNLSNVNAMTPTFDVFEVGVYVFELIVNNGQFDSFADTVQVTLQNDAPTANAGKDQTYSTLPDMITLDGSASSDPEQGAITYHWKQIQGWNVKLRDPNTVSPSFVQPRQGVYVFELVVNDGLQNSTPDVVGIIVGDNHAPVADAGQSRYIAGGTVTLDGTDSYDQDGYGTLNYQWTQISGTAVTLTGADTPAPLVSGFTPKSSIQKFTFELVVTDGDLTSPPSSVIVTVVPNFGTNDIKLSNPPFDPNRPTIVAFGGGNCSTGGGMTLGGIWDDKANWVTVDSYSQPYSRYGNMLIVYLSSVAPDYMQPIQTTGFSTGNMPAMETAWYVNTTYKDPRYAVNRVSLLDAVCSNLSTRVAQFHTTLIGGEQCWVDNYISNDTRYRRADFISGALNITCNPYRSHSYPVQRYITSSLGYENSGITAFGYLSVIGEGKNYQLNTASKKYYFNINSAEAITFYNESLYPGRILSPVMLIGPADGNTIDANGAVFSCEVSENAVGYQLLFGSDPDHVKDYIIVSDTPNPPSRLITELPFDRTWWTIRAYDQYGSTIHADPRRIQLPENNPPVANAGPDHVIYAGLDGKASITLDGSASSDADGDTLTFTWAWRLNDTWYEANSVNPTIELPVGVHTIQLMTGDGDAESTLDEAVITVVAARRGTLMVVPSAINRRSQMPYIMAIFQLPEGVRKLDGKVSLYPGGIECRMQKAIRIGKKTTVFAWFDKEDVMEAITANGTVELTVVGKQLDGPYLYGKDRVVILKGNSQHRF